MLFSCDLPHFTYLFHRREGICFLLSRQIPAQSSWILDGFPSDVTQAELLRRALGGAVEKTTTHDRTQLVVDPCPPKTPPPAPLVLDLAVLLDIPDECVARRAYSHAGA